MKRFKLEEINQEQLSVIDQTNRVRVRFKKGNYTGSVEITEIKPCDKDKYKKQKEVLNDIEVWLSRFHKNKI